MSEVRQGSGKKIRKDKKDEGNHRGDLAIDLTIQYNNYLNTSSIALDIISNLAVVQAYGKTPLYSRDSSIHKLSICPVPNSLRRPRTNAHSF